MPQREREKTTTDRPDAPLEDTQVRETVEATRQALESSAAEIERAKRLLQNTEPLKRLPGGTERQHDDDLAGETAPQHDDDRQKPE
jgi:hypothetical protein